MASFGKLRKYQRKKFKRYKEFNEIKTKNDEAYIVVKVNDLSSVLSEYSTPERPTLRQDFVDVIERKASFVPLDIPLVLEIQNDNLTSTEKIMVRKQIKSYFNLKKVNVEIEEDVLSRKARFLFTSGIICLCMIPAISSFNKLEFLKEVLSVLASFSIWELGSMLLFEYDDVKEKKVKYNHLSKIRVIYDKEI